MRLTLSLIIFLTSVNLAFSQNTIEHPERERIPYIEQIESGTKGDIDEEVLSRINSLFTNHSLKSEFGLNDDVILGSVAEVEVYNSSEYIVLDERGKIVVVFDESGAVVDSVGRSGQGPGEYESLYSIDLDGDDLFVADRSYSINKYTREGREFVPSEDFVINVVPDQLCILQNEVFIRGASNNNEFSGDEKVIHVYDKQTLNYKRSIVNPYIAEGFIGKNELSEGQIHCDETTNSIFVSFDILPHIYSFSSNGKLNWVSTINGFETRSVIEEVGPNKTPSVTFDRDSVYNRITGFVDLDENFIMVQKLTSFPRSENKFPSLSTYAVDKITGNISLASTVPNNWILLAMNNDEFIVNGILINRVPTLNIYSRN